MELAAHRHEGKGWWKEAALNRCRVACSPAACQPSLLRPCADRPGAPVEGAGHEDPSCLCLSSGWCLISHMLTQHLVGNADPCPPVGTARSLPSPVPPRPSSCPAVSRKRHGFAVCLRLPAGLPPLVPSPLPLARALRPPGSAGCKACSSSIPAKFACKLAPCLWERWEEESPHPWVEEPQPRAGQRHHFPEGKEILPAPQAISIVSIYSPNTETTRDSAIVCR